MGGDELGVLLGWSCADEGVVSGTSNVISDQYCVLK